MKKEELLKGISEILKKHENFLNENPELFYVIQDRLFKAMDDEEDQYDDTQGYTDEGDYYGEDYDNNTYGSDLFDQPEGEDTYQDEDEQYVYGDEDSTDMPTDEQEGDAADQWLKQREASKQPPKEQKVADKPSGTPSQDDVMKLVQLVTSGKASPEEFNKLQDILAAAKQQQPQQAQQSAPKKSSSIYRDWAPKEKYEPHHEDAIKKLMDEGWSHREAERLAGAHSAPTDFYSALKHTVKPSEPSPKMLATMKEIATDWLKNARKKTDYAAEKNPIKHAQNKNLAAHEQTYGDFSEAYNNFLNSDEIKGLKGRERHKAIQEFKTNWEQQNPEHKQKVIETAAAGQHFKEASEARAQRLDEQRASLLTAGHAPTEDMTGGYSSEAAGMTGPMSAQEAAQSVGGEQNEEGGFQANVKKDPHLHFAESNPEYMKQLKEKVMQKLQPQQVQRMTAIDSLKNKGE